MTGDALAEAVESSSIPPATPSSPDRHPLIRASRLTKTYGLRRALRALDLAIEPGERVAVLGANGAGKSTLIQLLALLIRPTSGVLEIGGQQASTGAREIRALIGVALHDGLLYPDLTASENLLFTARLYSMDRARERSQSLIVGLGLSRIADSRIRTLSRGQRQRVSVARALISDPRVVLLDEPDTGMDAHAFDLLDSQLRTEPERALVFTTHDVGHALQLASRLVLLEEGRSRDLGPATGWSTADLAETLTVSSGGRRRSS